MIRSQGKGGQSTFRVDQLKCPVCRQKNRPHEAICTNALRSAADTINIMPQARDIMQLGQLCLRLRGDLALKEGELLLKEVELKHSMELGVQSGEVGLFFPY